jgi:DNA topoisomerase-3
LFKRGFLEKRGKLIRATELGKQLVTALPESATLPDMTAQWEASLNSIGEKQMTYQQFMSPLTQTIRSMVASAQVTQFSPLAGLARKRFTPKKGKNYRRKKSAV